MQHSCSLARWLAIWAAGAGLDLQPGAPGAPLEPAAICCYHAGTHHACRRQVDDNLNAAAANNCQQQCFLKANCTLVLAHPAFSAVL